jgi:hypothetical protein
MFEKRTLMRIFGPQRDEVTRGWIKLYNEELHNLISPLDIIRIIKSRKMRWVGHVARMMEMKNVYKDLVGKPGRTRPLGKPMLRWKDTIKMDFMEKGFEGVDWTYMVQDRDRWRVVVNTVIKLLQDSPPCS